MNFDKSSIVFPTYVSSHTRSMIASFYNVSEKLSLSRYLGCLFQHDKISKDAFVLLCSKIESRMQSWIANSVSKAGRLVLIQSNLESMSLHVMQCFSIPQKFMTKLDGIC